MAKVAEWVQPEDLHHIREQYRELFEAIPDIFFVLRTDGGIETLNPAVEQLTGWTTNDWSGKSFRDFIYPSDLALVEDAFQRALRGETVTSYSRIMCKDGSLLWIESVARPQVRQGQIVGVLGIGRDIHQRKATEEALKALNEQLEDRVRNRTRKLALANQKLTRINEELEQFASMASHDLKEPLRTVSYYVQLLAKRYRGKLDADSDQFIGFVTESTSRMRGLIDSILSYSRLEKSGIEFKPLNPAVLIERVTKYLRRTIEERGATVTIAESLPEIVGDELQMERVFQNLICNALKFHKKDTPPVVTISGTTKSRFITFCVEDNGIGIEKRHRETIFRFFHRVHTQEYPGSGIGLAVCRKIVERHGGKIWVDSNKGKGSRFYFSVPSLKE